MNRRHGSIKIVFSRLNFTALLFVFALALLQAPISQAALQGVFKHRHCDTFLTAQTGFTNQAYSESKNGAEIYRHFLEIVGVHSSSLVEIVNSPKNANWTVTDILNFIDADRIRIERGLNELLTEFELKDDHRKMVEYVLEQYSHTVKKEQFAKQLEFYHHDFGKVPASQVNRTNYNNLLEFLYRAWAINRSAVSELQTAFEVKGVYALSVKVYELLPQQYLEEFVNAFSALGKSQILELEIDVASRDAATGTQVWVEVKNVNNRIMNLDANDLKKYREKKSKLREFNDIISKYPRLKRLFPDSIEFVWLIRGAGVERAVSVDQAKRGLYLFDRNAEGINKFIEVRTERTRRKAS